MKLKIEFNTDNAAFDDNRIEEIDSVLATFFKQLEKGWTWGPLKDSNGDTVGQWRWE